MSNTTFSPNTTSEARSDAAQNVSRADRIFAGLGSKFNISPDGVEWLKTALDPFPDETRKSPGFPDMISSKSIRYPIKTELLVDSAGGVPWDCHIAFQGLFGSTQVRATTRTANVFQNTGQGATPYDIGGIQVRKGTPVGSDLFVDDIAQNLLPTIPANPFRVVSMGLEVQNQTEPLYRSGGVCSYRMPSVPLEPVVMNVGSLTTAAATAVPGLVLRELPVNVGQALNIPDSVEDKAENGTYMVATMDGPTNEVNQVISGGSLAKSPLVTSNAVDYFPQIVGAALPYTVAGISNTRIPYNAFGAFFTNLSAQTKLKVILHAFIEEFPPPTATLLTSLATPSAIYDPEALMLYSRSIRHLPVAVPVDENFLGGFFLEAAKSIATWAAPKLLKGWNKTPEDGELDKIKEELKLIKEMRKLEFEEKLALRRAPINRQIVVTPTAGPRIVRSGKPPPLPPKNWEMLTPEEKIARAKENRIKKQQQQQQQQNKNNTNG